MDENYKEIAARKAEALRRWMEKKGITQQDLAAKIGKHRNQVGKWLAANPWPHRRERAIEKFVGLPEGFLQRIGAGADYDELVNSPFVSSALAPPSLRAVGEQAHEDTIYGHEYGGGDMAARGRQRRAEELGKRVRDAMVMEPANPDAARVLRRHQDTLEGAVEALTELIFRVGKHAVAS